MALGTGCAALLNHLFFILGEEGRDCCLIPLPYYAPFENNMNIFSGIIPFGVASAHPEAGPPTAAELNVAYGEAKAVRMYYIDVLSLVVVLVVFAGLGECRDLRYDCG